MYNGIITLDKIYGAPSRSCVTGVSKALGGRKQRTGHAGTLDTSASGALVVLAGYATRLSDYVMNLPKTYLANVTFGWETTTDDATGEPLSEPVKKEWNPYAVDSALTALLGVRMQVPPRVSAVMVDGHRAHKIARAGREPNIKPRPVSITSITYFGRTKKDEAQLLVKCHRGTYVRSLARDLGRMLGLGAHLSLLRRFEVGCFSTLNALPYNPQLPPDPERIIRRILPISVLATQYYSYEANAFCEKRLVNGLSVYLSFLRFRNPGVVPVSDGIMVVGAHHLCLGALRVEKGRWVVSPQANIPLGVEL